MKIVRDMPEQLIIAHIPWMMGILLTFFILLFAGIGLSILSQGEVFGLVFLLGGLVIGGACFIGFVRRVQVIFDRATDRIIHRRRSVLGFKEREFALSDLDGAELQSTVSSKGATLYRPVLEFKSGPDAGSFPMVDAYTNTRGPKQAVRAVNSWLETGRAEPS